VQQALFERALDYRALALRSLVAMLVGGAVGVTMAWRGFGVWALVGYQLSERAAAVVVLWTASDWRPGLRLSRQAFGELFSFGVNVVGANLLGFLNKRLDNLLIGVVLGPVALGYYEIAYKLLNTGTQLIVGTVSSVAFSTFSRMQDDLPRMRAAFLSAIRIVSVVAFPAFAGAAVVAPDLVPTLFGDGWGPSVPVFQALAFIGILYALFYFNTAVFLGAGRPGWRLGLTVFNTIANVVVFGLAVPYGIWAVAVGFAARGYVTAPVALWALRRVVGLPLRAYLRLLVAPTVATVAMAAAVAGLRWALAEAVAVPMRLGLGIAGGAGVYVAVLAVVAPARLAVLRPLAARVLPQATGQTSEDEA
jgi:PST family polysaccharide transporter